MKTVIKLMLLMGLLGIAIPTLAQDKATQSLTLTVTGSSLSFPAAALQRGQTSTVYSGISLTASGGITPYAYTVTGGVLPTGVALSSIGIFSGTPTAAGTYSFTVKVTDSESPAVSASQTFSIVIQNPLAITTTSLPGAAVGGAYSATIVITGGLAPYACSITTGALPAGLTLTNCTIAGTPTASGSFSFTLQVVDSASGSFALKAKVDEKKLKKE